MPQSNPYSNDFMRFWFTDPSVNQWQKQLLGTENPTYNQLTDLLKNDTTYDYQKAFLSGNKPVFYPFDGQMHWGSEGKLAGHPTLWKEAEYEKTGINPDIILGALANLFFPQAKPDATKVKFNTTLK